MKDRTRDNKRRRDKSFIARGGIETRGRKPVPESNKHFSDKLLEDDEWELVQAVHKFQMNNQIRFPSWSDVLGVIKKLGYKK